MNWFEKLFGFTESVISVRNNFDVISNDAKSIILRSKINGRAFKCGTFTTPKLNLLRSKIANIPVLKESNGNLNAEINRS